jgi:hypothetical protein
MKNNFRYCISDNKLKPDEISKKTVSEIWEQMMKEYTIEIIHEN